MGFIMIAMKVATRFDVLQQSTTDAGYGTDGGRRWWVSLDQGEGFVSWAVNAADSGDRNFPNERSSSMILSY